MTRLLVLLIVFLSVAAAAEEPAVPDWSELDELLLEDDSLPPDPADRDPLEPMNRGTHGLNEGFLKWVLDPAQRAYRFAIPSILRRGVVNFFSNMGEPAILVNDLLQFAPADAGETGARFVINSTLGLVGLFDSADVLGFPGHENDFGETLAAYHAPSGPYLVVPILGPSTVRDAFGKVVDSVLRPDVWLLGLGSVVLVSTGSGIASYDIERERLTALRETSVDFYAALRGAFLLDRDARVEARVCGLAWRSCEGSSALDVSGGH